MRNYYMHLFLLAKKETKDKNKIKPNTTTVFAEYKKILEQKKKDGILSHKEYNDAVSCILATPYRPHKIINLEGVDNNDNSRNE